MKGEVVYLIVYNYYDFDYSIIKVMEKLDEAYEYICDKEKYNHDAFKMIHVNNKEDITKNYVDGYINICCIMSKKYYAFDLCNYCNLSNYAIVPMKIT
jgi:hypothetical protein